MAEEKKDNINSDTSADATENGAPAVEPEDTKKEKKSDMKKLKAELEETNKKLEAAEALAAEANDKYLRLAAEYDNFRKRTQKDRENTYGDAVLATLEGLLPIIDNLQYASKFQSGDSEKFAEGVNLILGKLPEALAKLEVKAFGEAGEKFDPTIHNAVLHVEDDSLDEGVITDVLQCGYMYREKVLRYAMVKVAN